MFVAAFGKHPGWNDHIDDLGLETPTLVDLKHRLYVAGIGGNIDGGTWDKLTGEQQLDGFDHAFVWRAPGDVVVGRMWSSQDGKGRAKYPMIVCAEFRGYALDVALAEGLPALDQLRARCVATSDAGAVRQAMDESRARLRERVRSAAPGPELSVSDRALGELASNPDMGGGGADGLGMLRVMYQIEREMADYAAMGTATQSRARTADPRPQHIRVPACSGEPADAARAWMRAMLAQLAPATELLILIPLGRAWVDIIVGRADPASLYGLRASPKALALTTDIPYALDDAFIEKARQRLAGAAGAPERSVGAGRTAGAAPIDGASSGGRKLLIIAGVLIALALIVAAVGMLLNRGSGGSPETGAPPAPPAGPNSRAAPSPGPAPTGLAGSFDEGGWRELCGAYRTWFALLLKRLDEPPSRSPPGATFATRRELYRSDPDLARLLERVARDASDPWSIAGVSSNRDLVALERSAPDAVRTDEAQRRTASSLGAVRALANALGGGWPLLASMRASADRFERAGWAGAARALRGAAEGAAPGTGRDAALAIDDALFAGVLAARIDAAWARVGRHAEAALASGDAVLAAFGRFTQEFAGASGSGEGLEGLAALDRAVAQADDVGGRLAAFLARGWEETDQEAFKASRVHTQFVAAGGAATGETFEAWLFEVRNFPSLDPSLNPARPEGGWGALTRLEESERLIARLRDEFGIDPPADDVSAIRSLRARAGEVQGLPFNRANQARITAEAERIGQEADALWEGLSGRLEAANATRVSSAAEARARLTAREKVAANSDAINAAWRAWAAGLLETFPDAKYAEMLARAQAGEAFLGELNRKMPAGLEPAVSPRAWHEGLTAAAHRERERRLSEVLAAWPRLPPVGGGEDARAVDGAAEAFGAWAARLGELRADVDLIEDRLGLGFGVGEGEDPAAVIGRWKADPVWTSAGVPEAVQLVADRVAALAAVGASSDRAALVAEVERAGADRPELPIAAWRRLGALQSPEWPANLDELRTERRLSLALERVAGALPDEARRAALGEEIVRSARARWLRAAGSARSPGEIRGVMELRRECGVGLDDVTDDRVRYNVLAFDLRAAAGASGLGEDRAKALAAEFAAAVRPLAVAGRNPVPAVLAEMDSIAGAGDGPPPVDVKRIGPGSVPGWTGEVLVPDGSRVRYTAARTSRVLEFVRVGGAAGEPGVAPVFLCTIEAPIGLAAELSADPGVGAALAELLPEGERAGPLGWESAGGRLAPAPAWITRFPGGTTAADYPELAGAGRPTGEHPIQHFSPAAAMYLARALGCRLPTAAEWRAARALFASGDAGNLRDERWGRQWASADAVHKRGRVPLWPDAGSFWPSPSPEGLDRPGLTGANAKSGAGDDGFLFFAPAAPNAGPGLHHAVGNTAEFVFEDAPALELLADVTPGGVQAFAQGRAAQIGVIGGSAISVPELAVDRAWPVDLFDVQDKVGYSDVGFRLAFSASGPSAPRLSAAARIVARLSDEAFLAP